MDQTEPARQLRSMAASPRRSRTSSSASTSSVTSQPKTTKKPAEETPRRSRRHTEANDGKQKDSLAENTRPRRNTEVKATVTPSKTKHKLPEGSDESTTPKLRNRRSVEVKDEKAQKSVAKSETKPAEVTPRRSRRNTEVQEEVVEKTSKSTKEVPRAKTETPTMTKEPAKATRATRGSLREENDFKVGDLVWINWTDGRPYGAVILDYNEEKRLFTVRFAFDGYETVRKREHFLEKWNPEDNMVDTFQKYYEKMFKKSDPKVVQKALQSAKKNYDVSYQHHLKEQALKEEVKVLVKPVAVKVPVEKKVKKKSLSDLAQQLSTKAQEKVDQESSSVQSEPTERRSRKAPPTRRASGVTTTTPKSPNPTAKSPEPVVKTHESSPEKIPAEVVKMSPEKPPKMMPKSVKAALVASKSPPPIKLVQLANSPRKTPPLSPFGTSGSPLLSPNRTPPVFQVGEHVKISSGKAATVEKVIVLNNRPYNYLLRVENGPKLKQSESELRKMSASEYIVKPLVDQLVNDIVLRHERKIREAKKLDPTGLKQKVNSPRPVHAFTGVENQYKCPDESCTKSFRKERMLEAHIKHYHPMLSYSPVGTPKTTPRSTPRRTPKIKTPSPVKRAILSESEDDNSSIVSENSVPKSEQSVDEIDTYPQRVSYQCSCGWEGAEFWSQNPSGVPLRNHICHRPHKGRNMKETQVMREIYRTVDMGDYYDNFKLQVFPDQAAQEMAREVNLVQNEIEQRVLQPCQKIRQTLNSIRPQIEQMPTSNPDEVSFSSAEGVSTAQNAFPDTFGDRSDYTEQQLTLLKTVDANDQVLMDTFKENSKCEKILDEFEQYIEFMERDLDKKLMPEQRLPEVQMTLNE